MDKYSEFSESFSARSIICCPCKLDGSTKVVAVLQLMNKRSNSIVRNFQSTSGRESSPTAVIPFNSEDQRLIEGMAIEVSKVLKNFSLEAAYDSLFRDTDKSETNQLASYISQYTHKDVEKKRRSSSM